MRDSRIGAFGAIAVCMALLLKWQLLTAMAAQHAAAAMAAMVAAHAASRGMAVSYLLTHDYARMEGKAKPVAQPMGRRDAAWAALFGGLPLLGFGMACAAIAVAVLLAARWALGRYFTRRLGGITGDCLAGPAGLRTARTVGVAGMDIILIRHARPAMAAGLCYGRTDLPLDEPMDPDAASIADKLPRIRRSGCWPARCSVAC